MQKTALYLKQIFGNRICIRELSQNTKLPLYFTEKFHFKEVSVDKQAVKYILVQSKEKATLKIETLQKQAVQITKHTGCTPIWVFSVMRLSQRNALVQHCIPFVVPYNQIFIPNVLLNLTEKEIQEKNYAPEFSVSAQVVFIYILLNGVRATNAHQLAARIPYSVATLNRALTELVARELVKTEGSNTRKIYKPIQKKDYWQKGKRFLTNPVLKMFYVRKAVRQDGFYCSNEYALARLSWDLNESPLVYYAASANTVRQIDEFQILTEYNIFDCDYAVIEQFKYDPAILSNSHYIDVISLYAQFKDSYDERIQITLEQLLEDILC